MSQDEQKVRVDYRCPHCGGAIFEIAATVNVIIDKNDDQARVENIEIPFYYAGDEPAECMSCGEIFDRLYDVIVRE